MLKDLISSDISKLYKIIDVSDEGVIKVNNKTICIYKIQPANIVAADENTKYKIYQAYLSCIRGLPNTFQIIIQKEKTSFKNQIEQYKKRMLEVENFGLKQALKKYVEYLQELENANNLYTTKHYLVVENINKKDMEEIYNLFLNLKEFGVVISMIKSKKEVEFVLRKAMLNNEGSLDV